MSDSVVSDDNGNARRIGMLADKDAVANIAVKDLEVAKKYYEDTLGLKQVDAEDQEVIIFKSGNSKIIVYRSQYAGTNQATADLPFY